MEVFVKEEDKYYPSPYKHFRDSLSAIKNKVIESYILLEGGKDPIFEEEFKKKCFDNNFMIPKSLSIDDYINVNIENMKEDLNYLKTVTRNLAKDYEDDIKTEISYTSQMENVNISDFTTATMTVIGNKLQRKKKKYLKKNLHKHNLYFLLWKPPNSKELHINEFFGFFVRINVLLLLIRRNRESLILRKYLLQIYQYSIPYILQIEKFYYNKNKVNETLRAYYDNFELKYEFSYKNVNYMKNQPNTLHLSTTEKKRNIPEFSTAYFNFKEYNNYKEIYNNFISKFKDNTTIAIDSTTNRITFTAFGLLYKYSKMKESYPFKKIYSLIPLLSYLISSSGEFLTDNFINEKDCVNFLNVYPVEIEDPIDTETILTTNTLIDALINPGNDDDEDDEMLEDNNLNWMIKQTLNHVVPQYAMIRSIEKNIRCFYFKSKEYALFLDKLIINFTFGLYDMWSNINKIFKKNPVKVTKKLLTFYTEFVVHIGDDSKRGKRFRYITNKFENFKYIIQEFVVYLLYKNEYQVKRHILWEVLNNTNNTNVTLDLTMENYIFCCIKNANSMRRVFFNNTKEKFLDTRRKNKSVHLITSILDCFTLLKHEAFCIKTVFSKKFPKQDYDYVYLKTQMNVEFGEDWQKKIYNFWSFYNLESLFHKNQYGWELYLKEVFSLSSNDMTLIRHLFLKNKILFPVDKAGIRYCILHLSERGRSFFFYFIGIYENRFNFLRVYPLTLKETLHQLMVQKFSEFEFLPFAFSYCCKNNIHNTMNTSHAGFNKISFTPSGLYCSHKKNKSEVYTNLEKYNFFREKSISNLHSFVMYELFNGNIDTFNYFKEILFEGIEEEEEEEDPSSMEEMRECVVDQITRKRFSLSELLTLDQKKKLLEINIEQNPHDNKIKWNTESLNTVEEHKKLFLENLYSFNKIKSFLKKMCKWVTDWENRFKDDKRIYFYPPIGYMYVLKTKKSSQIKHTSYKLCLNCRKVKIYNDNIFNIYDYVCKDCEKHEVREEEYEKVVLIDTSEEHNIFSCITK